MVNFMENKNNFNKITEKSLSNLFLKETQTYDTILEKKQK